MSKQFEELKLAFVKNKIQVIILNSEGWVQDSCDSIFEVKELRGSLFPLVPLFAKIQTVLTDLALNQKITLEKCDWNWENSKYFLDIEITKYLLDTQTLTRLIIEEKTFEYEALEEAQGFQSNQVQGEHTELLNTILQLKKELQNKEKCQTEEGQDLRKTFLLNLQAKFEEPLILLQSWLVNLEKTIHSEEVIKITSAINFLKQVTEKATYFTGAEKDTSVLENTTFSLKNLLNGVLHTFDFLIKEKNIEIKLDIEHSLPAFFKGKKETIESLFFQLLSIVLKHSTGRELTFKVNGKSFERDFYELNFEFSTENRFVDDFDILKGVKEQSFFVAQLAKEQGGEFTTFLEGNRLIFKISLELISSLQFADNQQDNSLNQLQVGLFSKQESILKLVKNYCEQMAWDLEVLGQENEVETFLTKATKNNKFDIFIVDIDTIPIKNTIKTVTPTLALLPFSHSNLWQWLNDLGFDKQLKIPFSKQVFYDDIKNLLIKSDTMYTEKIDLSYIEDIVEDNLEMMSTLLEMLLDNIKEYPSKMSSEFHSQDFHQLRETAHKFKSCTAYTGLSEFNTILTDIERSDEWDLSNSEIEEKVNFIHLAAKKVQLQVEEKLQELSEGINTEAKQENADKTEV